MKLLDVAPADGNGNVTPPVENNPPTPAAAPAAATIVANAPSERERDLAAELERARQEAAEAKSDRVAHERTIMELEDKHDRYRKTVEAKPAKSAKKPGWTFFD